MKKEATDFALMAGAFATDADMAKQVCKLLADGDVVEAVARKLLGLVRDGKLKTQHHWKYCPTWTYPATTNVNWGWTIGNSTAGVSLTKLAKQAAA